MNILLKKLKKSKYMNKQIAKELKDIAIVVATRYSNTNREMNFNNESFEIDEIIPTGEHTATICFKKTSGKIGVAFFYYIPNGSSKGWRYFFPTDSHITGMRTFEFHKLMIESKNYKYNFIEKNNKE